MSDQLRITRGTGTCGITATKAADGDYASATSFAVPVPVTRATAALELLELGHVYDGTAQPAVVQSTPEGLTGVTVTYDGSATVR